MAMALSARRANVTLDLVDRVEAILHRSQRPMSRNEVLARLAAAGHATTRTRLNAAIAHLTRHQVLHDGGRDGVVWLGRPSLRVLERLARAKVIA
jgi:hypothetical protein